MSPNTLRARSDAVAFVRLAYPVDPMGARVFADESMSTAVARMAAAETPDEQRTASAFLGVALAAAETLAELAGA